MINLRYHIVSITAVFLALGIGTALGGTFLDRYTVDVLDRNIKSAEQRIADTEGENGRLEGEISEANARDDALIATGSATLFADELTDLPVLVVVSEGADADAVSNLRLALGRSGADLRGTLELRNALALDEEVDESLAEVVEQDPADPDAVRAAVQTQLRDAFFEAGVAAEEEPSDEGDGATEGDDPATTTSTTTVDPFATTTTVVEDPNAPTTTEVGANDEPTDAEDVGPGGEQPDIVTALLERELVRLTPGPGYDENDPILEDRGYRYVFVGGVDLEAIAPTVMLSLLPTTPRLAIPAVVVSPTVPTPGDDDEEPTATVVVSVRSNNERASIYNTVDDVDTFTGLTSTILLLRDLDSVETGHYGQAAGSSAVLPGTP